MPALNETAVNRKREAQSPELSLVHRNNLKLLAPGRRGIDNVGKRLRAGRHTSMRLWKGSLVLSEQWANRLCEALHLPVGWFDEPRTYEDIPAVTLELLPEIDIFRETEVRAIRKANLRLVRGDAHIVALERLLGASPSELNSARTIDRFFPTPVAQRYCAAMGLPLDWLDVPHSPEDVPARIREQLPPARRACAQSKAPQPPRNPLLDTTPEHKEALAQSENIQMLAKLLGGYSELSRRTAVRVKDLDLVITKERCLSLHEKFQFSVAFQAPAEWLGRPNPSKVLPPTVPPLDGGTQPLVQRLFSTSPALSVRKDRARRLEQLVRDAGSSTGVLKLLDISPGTLTSLCVTGKGLNDTTCDFICQQMDWPLSWLNSPPDPVKAPVPAAALVKDVEVAAPAPGVAMGSVRREGSRPLQHQHQAPARAPDAVEVQASAREEALGSLRRERFRQLLGNPKARVTLRVKVGLTGQGVDEVLSGESLLGDDAIAAISEAFGLPVEWFDSACRYAALQEKAPADGSRQALKLG
jgi:hypothetical protein